jgi:hypothetical protein
MTMTPPRSTERHETVGAIELLIREARARALRRRVGYASAAAAVVVALTVLGAMRGDGSPASPTGGATPAANSAALALSPCAVGSVTATLEGNGGSMGTFHQLFLLRNTADVACTVTGYPSVSLVSTKGVVVPQVVTHVRGQAGVLGLTGTGAVPSVRLGAHGGVASFWIADHDVPTGNPPAPCVGIARATITWPHAGGSASVPLGTPTVLSCGHVQVFPVVSGVSGSVPAHPLSFYFGNRVSD